MPLLYLVHYIPGAGCPLMDHREEEVYFRLRDCTARTSISLTHALPPEFNGGKEKFANELTYFPKVKKGKDLPVKTF